MTADAVAAGLDEIEVPEPADEQLPLPKRFCFVEGTHVATLRGEMPVQYLRVGDNIRARKGSFHTVSDVAIHDFDDLDPETQAKIGVNRLLRGAVDDGLPRRDLFMTEGQQFELSRRLEVSHAIRMTVRKSGASLAGFRFVVFACDGLPMIRAEGIWTTLTPVERVFPVSRPHPSADAPPAGEEGEAGEEASAEAEAPPVSQPPAARRATRRPLTRMLLRPESAPASHHTETGTPGP
jgi:hypothetical protein